MVTLIVQIIVGIVIGLYVGRAITLFVIASGKAKRARIDMVNAPTWTPSYAWMDYSPVETLAPHPLSYLTKKEYLKAVDAMEKECAKQREERVKKREEDRRKRRVQKATEYAQALQDRRRAFAWPYWEIAARRDEKREANLILRDVIAQQTMKALEELKHEADKRSKEVA